MLKKMVYKVKKVVGKFMLRSSDIRRQEFMDSLMWDEYEKELEHAFKVLDWMYD